MELVPRDLVWGNSIFCEENHEICKRDESSPTEERSFEQIDQADADTPNPFDTLGKRALDISIEEIGERDIEQTYRADMTRPNPSVSVGKRVTDGGLVEERNALDIIKANRVTSNPLRIVGKRDETYRTDMTRPNPFVSIGKRDIDGGFVEERDFLDIIRANEQTSNPFVSIGKRDERQIPGGLGERYVADVVQETKDGSNIFDSLE